MKKITKILALCLAMTMILTAFASCGLVVDTEDVEKARVKKETVLTVADDIEVNGAYYGYCFMSVYNQKLQENMPDSTDSSASSDSLPDVDVKEVKKEAIDKIIAIKMAAAKATENGFVLSAEDNKNISSILDSFKLSVTQSGIPFNEYCEYMGTSSEGVEAVITDEYIANVYYSQFIPDKYISAKHILIEAADESAKAEALTKIKEIKAKIDAGEDFDKLMKEFSTDPGLQTQPNGYTFTKGEMVPQFEEAAFALEVGKVSGIVETDYGYHIIKRIETSSSGVAAAIYNTADTEITDIIKAENEKLIKDVKVKENKKISIYDSLIK